MFSHRYYIRLPQLQAHPQAMIDNNLMVPTHKLDGMVQHCLSELYNVLSVVVPRSYLRTVRLEWKCWLFEV